MCACNGAILSVWPEFQLKTILIHSHFSRLIHQTFFVKVSENLVAHIVFDPASKPERRCSMLLVIGSFAGRQIISASSLSLWLHYYKQAGPVFTSAHTDTQAHIGSCTGELSAVVWRVWIWRMEQGGECGGQGEGVGVQWENCVRRFDILVGREKKGAT